MTARVRALRFVLLLTSMLLVTVALGWWSVPVAAALFAAADRRSSVPAEAGLAAAIAWLLLFLVKGVLGDWVVVALIARAMSLPPLVLPVVTVVFPGLLAWSAATLALALVHLLGRPRDDATRAPSVG